MNIYIATIKIAVESDNQSEASDAIAELLRPHEQEGDIIDWAYLKEENNPRFVGDLKVPIGEGELFA